MNIEKTALYQKLSRYFQKFDSRVKETSEFKNCLKILDELNEGKIVQ